MPIANTSRARIHWHDGAGWLRTKPAVAATVMSEAHHGEQ